MNYLSNAFSLQMLERFPAVPVIEKIEPSKIPRNVVSCIGHEDTAQVISNVLGFNIPMNRVSVKIGMGDTLYVVQLMGGRLPEGATTLPKGFKLDFLKITVMYEESLCMHEGEVCSCITFCPSNCCRIG